MQTISAAIDTVLDFIRELELSDSTWDDYKTRLQTIHLYCEKKGISLFSHKEAQTFTDVQMARQERGQISARHFRRLRRAAFLLADCTQGKQLYWKRIIFPDKAIGERFSRILTEYGDYLSPSLAQSTIGGVVSMIRQFLLFLEEDGLHSIDQLTETHVKLFMQGIYEKRTPKAAYYTWALRGFLTHLNESAQSAVKAERYLLRPAPNTKKVLPCFTSKETDAILAAVDTATAMGKRDYAILTLAIETGLRGVDIRNLRLTDIDWRKCEIAVVQSKTGEPIRIPLLPSVGNAVAEYILYARPESDSRHIFLRCTKPHIGFGSSSYGGNIISRYLDNAGIFHEAWDGKTFHAFRRTSGTRLLEAGVPLPDVAELLGHKVLDSAKRYISQNDDKMRDCCLNITEFRTRKDGLE